MGLRKNSGSVQIVEMSFVLPVAIAIMLSLIYLSFSLLIRVQVLSIVQKNMYDDKHLAGETHMYWQLTGKPFEEDTIAQFEERLNEELKKCCILPGFKAVGTITSVYVKDEYRITVSADVRCFGEPIFCISEQALLLSATDRVYSRDFYNDTGIDLRDLDDVYDTFF